MWQNVLAQGGLSLIGGLLSSRGAKTQNEEARRRAREQMAFQERMSSTAHQREVTDLRAAGLNPILSAGGSGASSPGGAMAPTVDELGPAVSTALQVRMENKQLKKLDQDMANQREVEKLTKQQKINAEKMEFNIRQDMLYKNSETAKSINDQELQNIDLGIYRAYPWLRIMEKAGMTGAVGAGAASAAGIASAKGLKGLAKGGMGWLMRLLLMRRLKP